nr:hypothetical protein [Human alphaherpesvirus 2]
MLVFFIEPPGKGERGGNERRPRRDPPRTHGVLGVLGSRTTKGEYVRLRPNEGRSHSAAASPANIGCGANVLLAWVTPRSVSAAACPRRNSRTAPCVPCGCG